MCIYIYIYIHIVLFGSVRRPRDWAARAFALDRGPATRRAPRDDAAVIIIIRIVVVVVVVVECRSNTSNNSSSRCRVTPHRVVPRPARSHRVMPTCPRRRRFPSSFASTDADTASLLERVSTQRP